jgi:hypothetical protein
VNGTVKFTAEVNAEASRRHFVLIPNKLKRARTGLSREKGRGRWRGHLDRWTSWANHIAENMVPEGFCCPASEAYGKEEIPKNGDSLLSTGTTTTTAGR